MSSRFKLSNKIFSLGLTASEISVYAYMSSLPSLQDTLDGKATITVKQSTIAQNCGIKAVQPVSNYIPDRKRACRANTAPYKTQWLQGNIHIYSKEAANK